MIPLPNPPLPVKKFANWNYFWTHGCDIHHNHTSATCMNPALGHNFNATRNNMMGGNTKGQWKTVLLS